ncbi:hypothetical protein B9Q02_07500 [Candidatus Marsarchaeota G1 archaeon BE_D]|jgi:hypothetical protein|uniref:Uncharacterized protein n=1 Tax=Candidatus Marsarchaeota G1 archaeon BE_D TaxID=1978156 RepID=A0A2R6AFP9_9ARCH|nr:MAG: hypothetical protein B9Q02_07500 [Candidatus Marsarchaeota G1 archaeon BE_D]
MGRRLLVVLSLLTLLVPWEVILYTLRAQSEPTLQQVTLTWNVVWVSLRAANTPQVGHVFTLSSATNTRQASEQILLAYSYVVDAAKLILLAAGALLITLTRRVKIGGVLMLCAPAIAIISYAAQLAMSPSNAGNNQLGLIVIPIGLTLSALVGILATMRANSDSSSKYETHRKRRGCWAGFGDCSITWARGGTCTQTTSSRAH